MYGSSSFLSNYNMELNNMCESIDKNQYKTWSFLKGQEKTFIQSGVGVYEIVDSLLYLTESYL